jgi:hypothetical protein
MKLFRIFLAMVLVTAGCGTTYKSFPPKEITKEDSPLIEKPLVGDIDQDVFDWKISEVKGKVIHYHADDPVFMSIYDRAVKLSQWQDRIRVENNEGTNTGAFMGGLLIPLLAGGYVASKKDPNSENDLEGFKFVLALPGIIAGGALLGYGISKISNGADLTDGHKNGIIQLIDDYNALTSQQAIPDTVMQPKP